MLKALSGRQLFYLDCRDQFDRCIRQSDCHVAVLVAMLCKALRVLQLDVVCRVRQMEGHRARVGTMAWNSHLLSSGSRDRTILQRDIRAPEDFNHKLAGHRSEVRTNPPPRRSSPTTDFMVQGIEGRARLALSST